MGCPAVFCANESVLQCFVKGVSSDFFCAEHRALSKPMFAYRLHGMPSCFFCANESVLQSECLLFFFVLMRVFCKVSVFCFVMLMRVSSAFWC